MAYVTGPAAWRPGAAFRGTGSLRVREDSAREYKRLIGGCELWLPSAYARPAIGGLSTLVPTAWWTTPQGQGSRAIGLCRLEPSPTVVDLADPLATLSFESHITASGQSGSRAVLPAAQPPGACRRLARPTSALGVLRGADL